MDSNDRQHMHLAKRSFLSLRSSCNSFLADFKSLLYNDVTIAIIGLKKLKLKYSHGKCMIGSYTGSGIRLKQ